MGSCFLIPNLTLSPSPSSLASASTTTVPRRAFFNPNTRHVQICPTFRFDSGEMRGSRVAARAIPNANSYALAFLLPVSLLAGTIIASIRLADKLDFDFFEELALNEAIEEAEAEEGEEEEYDDIAKPLEPPEPVIPRNRNRPKRVA